MYMEENAKNNVKKMSIAVIVMVNVIFFTFAGMNIGESKTLSTFENYTSDWEKVDVTIDDMSFEDNGSDRDDGVTTYKFIMNRILNYTYKGKDYHVNDKRSYESRSKDFSVELRNDYTDGYEYKVNPASPTSVSKSYSDVSDSTREIFNNIRKVAVIIFIAIPVIFDIVVFVKYLRRKRNVFEEE